MGVYGYGWSGSAPIPEGYLTVKVPTPDGEIEREILHPANPGSVYHMTKTLDQLLFAFYAPNDQMRITDLHQGIVWGTQTPQTVLDERLINRFDYDGDYGTVLNRFLMQAAIGHPLTVHGTGGQTRAFIHIRDTVRCIQIALENPPERGDKPKVFNQVTESHRVARPRRADLQDSRASRSRTCRIPVARPCENELNVSRENFLALGLNPTTLTEGLLEEARDIALRYKDRADVDEDHRSLDVAPGHGDVSGPDEKLSDRHSPLARRRACENPSMSKIYEYVRHPRASELARPAAAPSRPTTFERRSRATPS